MMNSKKKKLNLLTTSILLLILIGVGFYFLINQKHLSTTSNEIVPYLDSVYSDSQTQKSIYGLRVIFIPNEQTSGVAELDVYFDKNTGATKILEASYGGETYRHRYNYYFDDINNFILEEKNERWDRPYSEEGRQQNADETSKYYFSKIKMVQWEDPSSKTVDPKSEKFKKKEEEILVQLQKFLDLVSSDEDFKTS